MKARKGSIPGSKVALRGMLAAAVVACAIAPAPADAQSGFTDWISNFYSVAARYGVTRSTYRKAFSGVNSPDRETLEKAHNQPEFTTKIWDYLDSHVNAFTVENGRRMGKRYASTLAAIEQRYGVDRSVLLAIWSMESNYGAVLQDPSRLHYVPRALATLAYYDKSRAKYARQQLISALKILQNGDVEPNGMFGSWAGAMGQTQFIPTSYDIYAVDADGDGRRDIWRSVADTLASSANLLHKNGWRTGQTWGYEAVLPSGGARYKGQEKTLRQWAALGFTRPDGKGFPVPGRDAVLKMPGGSDGPVFLMARNFYVIKHYNQSDYYALAVGLLADRIAGYGGVDQSWPRPAGSLDVSQKFEIQTRLKSLGYYAGDIDGNLGSGSRAAIAAFQEQNGLTADGEPSHKVLEALRR
ncbi:lytic murein transglycosylase [Pararhizobium mangrovi]|uniref:Lytic murein transglycosylase n=1 Tax=Pararhizobium mangrovi TaxID=2590452 RepID=A0A506UBE8_9HYPH|nr:lytic murein transglycosylase [Pararhizobium mangrovi]TPW29959.1 lytic murein transglycosylase [Pararhizobium mangrovi]